MEAGQNCFMGHTEYAEHPLNNFLLQMLDVNSMGAFSYSYFISQKQALQLYLAEGLEQPKA